MDKIQEIFTGIIETLLQILVGVIIIIFITVLSVAFYKFIITVFT